VEEQLPRRRHAEGPSPGARRAEGPVTVRVFVMLGIYFVSMKYMFLKCKACVWLCEAFENLKCK
jgi:hypothetical protein